MNLATYNLPNLTDAQISFSTLKTDPALLAEAKDRGFYSNHADPYVKLFEKIFFKGGKVDFKPGLDEEFRVRAMRYLKAFMRSFAPSHEDKEAVSALILSELAVVEKNEK